MKKIIVERRKNHKGEYTSWQYRFEVAPIGGKRKWISKAGFATDEQAYLEGLKAYESYINGGQVINPSEMSVADFMNLWYEKYCKINLKITTCISYKRKINNNIIPLIGKYSLNAIRTDSLQNVINTMFQNNYSRNSILSVKGILTKSFKWAKKNKYIRENPALELEMPLRTAVPKKGVTRKKVREYLNKDVIDDLFRRFPEGHPCHIPLILGYRCGLRLGEAFAVTWEDINFKDGTLTINRQIQFDEETNRFFISPPKYNSYRTIPLDESTLELLKRTQDQQKKSKQLYGEYWTKLYISDDHYVNENGEGKEIHFINIRENGTLIRPQSIKHVSRIMRLKFNHPEWDFHSLRHTHCADLIDSGLSPAVVKTLMGHKNIETTLDIYDHMTKFREQKSIEIIRQMYK